MEKYGFIIGNWYKYIENDKSAYYIKIENVTDTSNSNGIFRKIFYSEKIQNNKHLIYAGYWANTEMETIALENPVDISEIIEFLPKDHPDLLKITKQSYDYLIPILTKLNTT